MKGLRKLLLVLGVMLLATGVALAAGGEAASGEHHYDWTNLGFRLANFAIFIAIIYYAAGKKLIAFFGGRRKGIEQELNDLETRKTDAKKQLGDVEKRIADLENERKAIIAEYQAQGEALKAAIISKAETSARQIVEQAKKSAENEVKYAKDAMREELADMIVDATEKLLKERLDGNEQEKLIDKYLTKVVLN
ncbi:F0F1 ATP synthase subunit B [Oleidesulfovibrio alaskensis]|uniref:F0F1 ATP synthase subunit B n=1 Tax=Oleidesulfovibrio alaskensis TaxID=58180 RepID=UPI0003FB103D|nr:F0F1 ATP synthase subunit B [Oleidesulfovibrio alaskensis]